MRKGEARRRLVDADLDRARRIDDRDADVGETVENAEPQSDALEPAGSDGPDENGVGQVEAEAGNDEAALALGVKPALRQPDRGCDRA